MPARQALSDRLLEAAMRPFAALSIVALLLASTSTFAQAPAPKPPAIRTIKDFDLFVCQDNLKQWQEWYKANLPIVNRTVEDLHAEQERSASLQRKLESGREALLLRGAGVGAGLFLAFAILKSVGRLWKRRKERLPLSPVKKQLIVLLLAATWISAAGIIAEQQQRLVLHPINLAFTVWMYSLPALLFGA